MMYKIYCKAKAILKKQSAIWVTIILTIVFCFIIPCAFAKNINFYFSWIAAVSGVATMFLAFSLFDRLDSKKAAFGRELDAVDKLASSLFNIDFFAIVGSRIKFDNPGEREFVKFSINNSSLGYAKNVLSPYSNLKVYFSPGIVENLRAVSYHAHNIWVPLSIKEAMKPSVFPDRIKLMNADFLDDFVLLTSAEELVIEKKLFYSFSYEDRIINNHGDYLLMLEKLLSTFAEYYSDRLGVIPDFQGH